MTLPINDKTYMDQWHYLHRSITIPTPINDITYTNQLHWSGKGFLTLGIYLLVFRLRRGLRFDSDTTRAQLCTPCSKLVAENVQPFGWKRKESQAFMLYLATHVGDGGGRERERELDGNVVLLRQDKTTWYSRRNLFVFVSPSADRRLRAASSTRQDKRFRFFIFTS